MVRLRFPQLPAHSSDERCDLACSGSTEEIAVDGAFVAIGHKPNTDFLKGHVNAHNDFCAPWKMDDDERGLWLFCHFHRLIWTLKAMSV